MRNNLLNKICFEVSSDDFDENFLNKFLFSFYTYPTTLLNLVVFLCFSLLGNLFV